MTSNIYIIKLANDKYYIGEAVNVEKKLNEHASGTASKYTSKYKPTNIKKVIPKSDPSHVNKYILKYMIKYGMNSVRGGSFENEILNLEQIKYLNKCGIKQKEKEIEKDISLSIQEKQINEQKKYNEEIMKQPEQLLQRRRPELYLKNKQKLDIKIRQANGTCWICGLDGHYMRECTNYIEDDPHVSIYGKGQVDELGLYFNDEDKYLVDKELERYFQPIIKN